MYRKMVRVVQNICFTEVKKMSESIPHLRGEKDPQGAKAFGLK